MSQVIVTTDYDVTIAPEIGDLTTVNTDFLVEQLEVGLPEITFSSGSGFALGTFTVSGIAIGLGLLTGIGEADAVGTANGFGIVSGSVAIATGTAAGAVGVTGIATGPGLIQGIGVAVGVVGCSAVGVATISLVVSVGVAIGTVGVAGVGRPAMKAVAAGAGNLTAVSATVSTWQNTAVANQTAQFKCEYDAVPTVAALDDPTGLSNGAASAFTALACIVRFNNAGAIDARNGTVYGAIATVNYTAGTSYHVRIMGDMGTHTYDVYVTPSGGSETQIAAAYAFRAEQATVTSLNNFAVAPATVGGTVIVTNLTMVATVIAPVVNATTFNISLPATVGQVVGIVTATGSPTAWTITAVN